MAAKGQFQTTLDITRLVDVQNMLKTSHFLETKWLSLGLQLGLLMDTLKRIDEQYGRDVTRCLLECLSLWLRRVDKVDEKGGLTWDTLATALANIGENVCADNARQKMKEETLQSYHAVLSQCLINPVKMSQLLFSERCISEETLDKMETLEGPFNEKKTSLLSALYTAISSDHKKLKALARVLSKFEETQGLAERIINEYSHMFPDDFITPVNIHEVVMSGHSDQLSPEDHASDILHCHYGTLSQSLQHSLKVAQLLCGEGVVIKSTLAVIENEQWPQSEEKAISVLLRAVRHAVHSNYHNLAVFASVLLKISSNVPCAKAILMDYKKAFPNDSLPQEYRDDGLRVPIIPQNLSSVFGSVRKEFAMFFHKIREVINANPPPLDELKRFLKHGYPHLKSQVIHSNSIDDILDLVNDHCTLINISCLEGIVESFKIEKAKAHIKSYKDAIQSSCKKTKASLCLGESLKVTATPSLLLCETVVFVLNWDPRDCTLEDIEEIVSESLGRNVEIRYIQRGRSIVVTCFFPLDLLGPLITKAHEALELLKKKGLMQLIISQCTIYDKCKRDQETEDEKQRSVEDLRHKLESLDIVVREMATEIKSIHYATNAMSEKQMLELKQRENDDLTSLLTTKEALEEEPDTQKTLEISESKESELKQSLETAKKMNKALMLQVEQFKKGKDELMLDKEKLQEVITSLSQQLREKDKRIEELKQSLKDLEPSVVEPSSSGDDKESVTGDTSRVIWKDDSSWIHLKSSNAEECQYVVSRLKKERCITLSSLSLENALVIINNLNECAVRELYTTSTPLDNAFMTALSKVLISNKTIKTLSLKGFSRSINIKQITDALIVNTTLEELVLSVITITDEDTTHFSVMLSKNKALKVLHFSSCNITDIGVRYISEGLAKNQSLKKLQLPNCEVTDKGVRYICEGLTKNQTLTTLDISYNRQVTSASTSTIVDLIKTTTSLKDVQLYNTSLNDDDIKTICTELADNTTIQALRLSEQHEEYSKKLDSYQVIKDRLVFRS